MHLTMEQELTGIIEAKIRVPPERGTMVRRTTILDDLTTTDASIVIVQAPAGFGKSTVLEQWAHGGGRRFAWVSLDPSEDDATLFWRHVYAALRVALPNFGSALFAEMSRPRPDLVGVVIPGILNELAQVDEPLVLVLDDYHRISAVEVAETVQLLVRHLPRGATLAIGARSRPRLDLARSRSRGRVHDIGASDLSLTLDESTIVLQTQNPDRTDEEVRWIHETTEGWPAGVYLFGLLERADTSVRTTTDIRDYLMTEVLATQSPDDLRFMRETSILSRLEAGACDFITGTGSARERLQRLAGSNLLILPLDPAGAEFRYHHLLQSELQSLLDQDQSVEAVASLHRRAAEWTVRQGDISEAVHHAVRAGDTEGAVALVSEHWYGYIMTGRVQSAYRWLSEFSQKEVTEHPPLLLAGAMIAAFAGYASEAKDFAARAERIAYVGEGLAGAATYESSVAFMRSAIAADGPVRALADAQRALEIEPIDSPYRPMIAAMTGTFIYSTALNDAEAYPLLLEGSKAATGPPEAAAYAVANLALLHAWRNDRDPALGYAEQAMQMIDEANVGGLVVYGLPFAIAALLHSPQGGSAERQDMMSGAERAERTASNAAPFDSMVLRTTMAEAYLAMGEPGLARAVAERALSNLAAMREGGLVAGRLDAVIRRINAADPDPRGHTEPVRSLLSPREVQILSLLTTEETLAGIGRRLFVSRNTVKTHTSRIYRKLGVSDRRQAVAEARRLNLI